VIEKIEFTEVQKEEIRRIIAGEPPTAINPKFEKLITSLRT